jgi:OPA family glycerol-3-phosphate transporter-like MFS transporter
MRINEQMHTIGSDVVRRVRGAFHLLSKRMMLSLCWLAYTAAYLARSGISAGYPTLALHYGTNEAWLGAVGSAFFAAYAIGQLVNGFLGDRVSPARFVLLSMVGSTAVYALILTVDNAAILPWLWGLNGVFLSMLWGPMLRLLCMRFSHARKETLAVLMGTAPVGGYCLGWLVLAPAVPTWGWQAVFIAPLALTALLIPLWAWLSRGSQACESQGWSQIRRSPVDTLRYIHQHGLWRLVLTSLCLGLVKENLALLLPALFVGFLGTRPQDAAWLLVLSPLAHLTGLLLGQVLKRPLIRKPAPSLAATFGGMAVSCAGLVLFGGDAGVAFAAIFAITALAYLGSCIQISYIPLAHVGQNMLSTLVGLFDFSNYIGAALASALLGELLAEGRLIETTGIWLGVCLLAAVLALGQAKQDKARDKGKMVKSQ